MLSAGARASGGMSSCSRTIGEPSPPAAQAGSGETPLCHPHHCQATCSAPAGRSSPPRPSALAFALAKEIRVKRMHATREQTLGVQALLWFGQFLPSGVRKECPDRCYSFSQGRKMKRHAEQSCR